jgi:lipid A 3-O-deacylase
VTDARVAQVIAAAALIAACAASPEERIGERVLPDTQAIDEHFRHALTVHGPYRFQTLTPPLAKSPAAPSLWARLWPASASHPTVSEPVPAPRPPAPTPEPTAASFFDHFWPPLAPSPAATTTSARTVVAEVRSRPPTTPATTVAAAAPRQAEGRGSDLSEVRVGALKHAVAFGHRAKEQGIDGSLEALFRSPDWLAWAWSPRPHLGIVANGSKRATDFLYGGLTWGWTFRDPLFVELGLGVSVHDGMLDNSQITGKSRLDRREFGCRALFRESLEFGYRFLERHSISLMWEHHSHGSLCSDENEGIDNAGVRYGLRM